MPRATGANQKPRGGKGGRGGRRGGGRGSGARGGGGRSGGGGGGGGGWHQGQRADYQEIQKKNALFERNYNELDIVPQEQREEFWETMRRELPNSFRFTGSKGHALAVQQRLIDHYIPEITSVKNNGSFVDPPRPLEWFPEKLAWSMTTPKQVVRKFAPFKSFQKFLVSETSVGNISRQEVVSMIPPLLMDLHPGMTVLDLCAAPGSKSAQLIEMVHRGEEARTRKIVHEVAQQDRRQASPDGMQAEIDSKDMEADEAGDWSDHGRATGLLIANDINYTRAQMLVHQVKRLNSPNLIVTNHDASQFPSIRVPSATDQPRYLKFDRILADVPCSGDGTCRKNYSVWKDWSPSNGIGLHTMQVRILVRALQMLKKGGRVVYSTCSMNPVENEAVVSSAIYRCGGISKVRLVDTRADLPGLKRVPGLTNWKVMDKRGEFWNSWDEAEKDETAQEQKLVEGHFPPPEAESIPLENCMRVYPHLQDTGGFFIAVLEKVTEIKELQIDRNRRTKASPPCNDATSGTGNEREGDPANGIEDAPSKRQREEEVHPVLPTKKPRTETSSLSGEQNMTETVMTSGMEVETSELARNGDEQAIPFADQSISAKKTPNAVREEPYRYLAPDHPELTKIYAFYQISPRFPRDRWMVRNATGEPAKAIYYTSRLVRDILQLNEGRGMKFVQSGIKMFMKQDAQGQDICRWRIQSEGLPIIEAWVGEDRIIRLYKRQTLHKLLKELFPKVSGDKWADFDEVGERIRDLSMGCCVLRVEPSDAPDGFKERIVMPMWRSIASVNIMLAKEDRRALLLRIYNDNDDLIDHSEEKKRDEAALRERNGAPPPDGQDDDMKKDDPLETIRSNLEDLADTMLEVGNEPLTADDADSSQREANDHTNDSISHANGMDQGLQGPALEGISTEQEISKNEEALRSYHDQVKEELQGAEVAPGISDEASEINRTV